MVILWSGWVLARSELTGESIFGLGDIRDFASDIRGEKSWVLRPPKSILGGCEMVSKVDIGTGVAWDGGERRARRVFVQRPSRYNVAGKQSGERAVVTYFQCMQITVQTCDVPQRPSAGFVKRRLLLSYGGTGRRVDQRAASNDSSRSERSYRKRYCIRRADCLVRRFE